MDKTLADWLLSKDPQLHYDYVMDKTLIDSILSGAAGLYRGHICPCGSESILCDEQHYNTYWRCGTCGKLYLWDVSRQQMTDDWTDGKGCWWTGDFK